MVDILAQRGHDVRVLSRKPAAAVRGLPAGAMAVSGHFDDPASLARASEGIDAVSFMVPAFLESPDKALQYIDTAMRAAAAGGARLIVWNTGGRFPEEGGARVLDKAMLDQWRALQASGLPLISIAPTTYMENLLGPGPYKAIRLRDEVAYPVLASRKMGWIAARDVSAFVVAALERPQFAGRVFRVSGPQGLTGPELAQAFADVLGRTLRFRTLTPDEMRRELEDAYGAGAGDEVAEEYRLDQIDPHPPAKYYEMGAVLRDLPIEMTSIRSWIAQHAAAFTPLAG